MLHIGGAALSCAIPRRLRAGQRAAMVVVLGAALIGSAAGQAQASPARCPAAHERIRQASRPELQGAVVCLINQQRQRRGLPRLRASRLLDHSAQGWTNYMVIHRLFSHGGNFAARISGAGFRWSQAGENIASGFATPAAVVRGWMASPDHCRNILSPNFGDVGTGVSPAGFPGMRSGTWTQDFALPLGARLPSSNWGPAQGCPYR